MKLAIDIQTLQGPAAHRGLGIYLKGLLAGLLHQIKIPTVLVANDALPIAGLSDLGFEIHKFSFEPWQIEFEKSIRECNSRGYASQIERLGADRLLLPSIFEHEHSGVFVPKPGAFNNGVEVCGLLHDFIPLIFKKQYFKNERYADFYLERFDELKQYNLLFCNSKSTKEDFQSLMPNFEGRLQIIWGGNTPNVDSRTHPEIGISAEKIVRIFYPSGPDWRKNAMFAIEVVSKTSASLDIKLEFHLSGSQFHAVPDTIAKPKNLKIVLHKELSHEAFWNLFLNADVIIFPSRYEGFGIPVVDAVFHNKCLVTSKQNAVSQLGYLPSSTLDGFDVQEWSETLYEAVREPNRFQLDDCERSKVLEFLNWQNSARSMIREIDF